MTEHEYKRLERIQGAIAEQQRKLAAKSLVAEERSAAVLKAITDLLVAVKKRTTERDLGQHPF